MEKATPTSVATSAKTNTPFFGKEGGEDFFSGTDFFADVQRCACDEQEEEIQRCACDEQEEEIHTKTEEQKPDPAPTPPPPAAPTETVKESEEEEEDPESQEEVQKKPIFETKAPNDIQRSCRECEEGEVVYRQPATNIQLLDDVKPDGSRESIITAARTMLDKIQAKNNDGSGKRVGAQYLLEIFHLAAPGVWDDTTIENIGGQLPSWCGIFAVWAHKKAGKNIGDWQMGKGVSAFHTLTQTTAPQPGDIGYIDQPYQHHCIVVKVEGDTVYSIDGNSGLFSEVKENVKPLSNYSGFFTAFATSTSSVVQTKLTVGQPDDIYEKEADSVATQVIQRMATPIIQRSIAPVKIQRKPIFESNSPEHLQRKCAACEQKEKMLQKKGGPSAAPPSVESTLAGSKGSGSPLPSHIQQSMGSAMGADFSGIRIHTDSSAVQMNKDLHAQAFTHGNHIYFNSGKYNTAHSSGQHLLAHELTHTIQQGAAGKAINLLTAEEQTSHANDVYDALDGWTSSNDSAIILSKFQGLSANDVDAILNAVAARAEENVLYVYDWLSADCVTSDWKALLRIFIQVQSTQITELIAKEVLNRLNGYTSDDDSKEIRELLTGPTGGTMDNILGEMETQGEYLPDDMAVFLFGDLQDMDAHNLSLAFFGSGSVKALEYATHWYAYKIKNLISGWTSMADSNSILLNFRRLPNHMARVAVYAKLGELTQAEWNEPAALSLMDDMQQGDYNTLRSELLPELPVYSIERNFLRQAWDFITDVGDYLIGFVEYVVCGVAGVIAGIFDAIASIVSGIVDLAAGIVHFCGWLLFKASGGAICRESADKVHDFVASIGQAFNAPGEMISRMWEETKLEASLIEGPFEECQLAIFWVRRVTNFVVNIVLLIVAGYGAVKAALEAIETIKTISTFGEFLTKVGEVPIRLLRSMRQLPASLASGAARIVSTIRNIDEIISAVRTTIGFIRLAVADENFFTNLRAAGTELARERLAAEREFWRRRREIWRGATDAQETRLGGIENATDDAIATADTNRQAAEAQILEAEAEANTTRTAANATETEVRTGQPTDEPNRPVTPDVPNPEALAWEQSLSPETRAMLDADPELRRMWHNMDPDVRRALTYCNSPCIPVNISPQNLTKVHNLITRLNLSSDDRALREYLHMFRDNQTDLANAIDALNGVTNGTELQQFMDNRLISAIQARAGVTLRRGVGGLWEYTRADGVVIREFEFNTHGFLTDNRGTNNFFQSHHGIQDAWARERFAGMGVYGRDDAPALLLRTRNFADGARGTPHGLINDLQGARRATVATRTFAEERAFLVSDMNAIGIPAGVQGPYLAEVDAYFGRIYNTLRTTLTNDQLTAIFGTWTP